MFLIGRSVRLIRAETAGMELTLSDQELILRPRGFREDIVCLNHRSNNPRADDTILRAGL
jgi:hypothetical protein